MVSPFLLIPMSVFSPPLSARPGCSFRAAPLCIGRSGKKFYSMQQGPSFLCCHSTRLLSGCEFTTRSRRGCGGRAGLVKFSRACICMPRLVSIEFDAGKQDRSRRSEPTIPSQPYRIQAPLAPLPLCSISRRHGTFRFYHTSRAGISFFFVLFGRLRALCIYLLMDGGTGHQ
jgi:hypothetical protein